MRFAFCVFSYYPFGGMERNLLRIALHCVAHGHQVAIFTQRWDLRDLCWLISMPFFRAVACALLSGGEPA